MWSVVAGLHLIFYSGTKYLVTIFCGEKVLEMEKVPQDKMAWKINPWKIFAGKQ